MTILAFLSGTLLPTAIGWLLLRALEGSAPVLSKWERIALGFLLGLTLSMFAFFLAHTWFGVPLNALPMLAIEIGLLILYGGFVYPHIKKSGVILSTVEGGHRVYGSTELTMTRGWLTLLKILNIASVVKVVIAGVTFLLLTPAFLDDVIENWNLRAKVFLNDRALTLLLPGQDAGMAGGGVNSYPPTVPLAKAWLNILGGGEWNEALANSLHLLWFGVAVVLLFAFLRRAAGLPWALLGSYVLMSLPLVVMHATNPYADIFMAAHVLAAGTMTASALLPNVSSAQRGSFLRIAAVCIACLPFTKNEGLLLYFPPAILGFLIAVATVHMRKTVERRTIIRLATFFIVACAAVTIPWLLFKWGNGLAFGNAKGISGLEIEWEPLALLAIVINTFFEANWLIFPALFLILVLLRGKYLLRAPLLTLFLLAAIPAIEQIGIFTLTGLSTEAMKQTGYARGLMHIMPVFVILTVMLVREWLALEELEDIKVIEDRKNEPTVAFSKAFPHGK